MSIKIKELYVCETHGFRAAAPEEVVRAARDYMTAKCRRGRVMNSPRAVGDFLSLKLGQLEHEMFCVLLLDLCGSCINVQSRSEPAVQRALGLI
jgi:DNA repair protein RadC